MDAAAPSRLRNGDFFLRDMDVRPDAPGPAAPSVSVIICAYTDRRWPVLVDAVGSALEQVPSPLEVVLVIDHNDALAARARAELDERVRVVANAEQQGLSGARNTGVALA